MNAAESLQRIPMFAGLEPEIIQALAQRAAARPFTTGQILFNEGDPCDGVFLLVEGSVKIFKTSSSGRQLTLAVETAPATVAEVPLFDGGAYPASVQAVDSVVALFIHKRDFRAICLEHPEVPLRALSVFGRRLRALVALLETMTFGSVRQRLARVLLELADQTGGPTFALPWTHQEIALNLGTVREVISRNLNRFQMDGFIRMSHREVTLADREGLQREAEAEI
ncbi:MAG TPA: Crp/Fnr family transcriptional regulator [Bryobacteraceae bacterium]|nr:Crp/Fnr family transcriptional regulator [Bryobacteraceae bacterium]